MVNRPTREQLRALTPIERFNFRVTHTCNSRPQIRRFLTVLGSSVNRRWIEWVTSKTVRDHGFENFRKIDPARGLLIVVNHRSFYDQFVIAARLFRLFGPHHNIYFPVRANFFYDNLFGLLVNLPLAFGAMYPPIIRDPNRRHWNRVATDIIADLLTDAHNMVGFHPEGTRNRGPDPYHLLPPKPGCGELIYRANPNVIPVFLQGFPRNPLKLYLRNLMNVNKQPPFVHMVMGEPLDFSEECKLTQNRKTYLAISRKVMAAIADLAKKEQEIRKNIVQTSRLLHKSRSHKKAKVKI